MYANTHSHKSCTLHTITRLQLCTRSNIYSITLRLKHELPDKFSYTNESKIHSHFHFDEGEMSPLNTARFRGSLSPPLPSSLIQTRLRTPPSFITPSFYRPHTPSFLHAFGSHCLSVHCTVYSLLHSHCLPVFKLSLSVCVCESQYVSVSPPSPFSQQRPQLLPVC